jgi:Fe-S cluster assembly protein SufD
VAPIAKVPFEPAGCEVNGLTLGKAEPLAFAGWEGSQLVFVNGHYAPELSSLRPLPGGVKAGSLEAAFSTDAEWVEPHLARYAAYQDHAFVALNTAFMVDGAFLYVPKGKIVEEPIHLLFISTAHEQATVSHPRNLIVVGQDSRATIVESYVGIGEGVYFTNAVTEIVSAENAVIDHYKLQRESPAAFHIGILQAHLDRSSHFTSHSIALGGALVRNEINAVLDGEGGECTLNGLYLVTGEQHVDNHTQMAHVKAHCTSRELYKGIVGGKARGVFNGKIVVHESAPKTDAKQTNNNLLLSQDASVDTKPQLEINNNDVKCTHGSTIGRLDQDQIFYLRSRGIDPEGARSLLMYAFASEVINRIKIERIRSELDRMLMARLQKKHLSWEGL